jgi:hypothetical protein
MVHPPKAAQSDSNVMFPGLDADWKLWQLNAFD